MNATWRAILRTRSLAAVRVHRKPAPILPARLPVRAVVIPRPHIHILFRPDAAESWMDREVSTIPHDWLRDRGFGSMEFFDVKVGVAPASAP